MADQPARTAHDLAAELTSVFDDIEVGVMIPAVALFLYHVHVELLAPQGVTLGEFASDLGAMIGKIHAVNTTTKTTN